METLLLRNSGVLPVERINHMGLDLWPEPVIWIWPKDDEAESINPMMNPGAIITLTAILDSNISIRSPFRNESS